MSSTKQLTYECQVCGTKFPLWKQWSDRNRRRSVEGHIKDLYCFRCEEVTKHEQLPEYRTMEREDKMNNLTIINQNGVNVVDSREVAEMVDKRHDNLVRDIDGYMDILHSSSLRNGDVSMICDFFIPSSYESGTPSREYRNYLITRKGCDMVANKMTGEKGVLFTAAYVTKFEQMEKALVPQFQIPQTLSEALRLAADLAEEKATLEVKVIEMKPKADFHDSVCVADNDLTIQKAAKILNTGEKRLFAWLRDNGYLMKDNQPVQKYIDQGYFRVIPKTFNFNGVESLYTQTVVTGKGLTYFRERYANAS